MSKHEEAPTVEASSSPTCYAVGSKVRLTKAIWDDGEDHHPPGWLAQRGEVLVVRQVHGTDLAVSHEDITDSSFMVFPGEYEAA